MISATLYGRIAREPELVQPMTCRDAYVRFYMAVETGRKDENGNRIAQFVSISVFGKQGDTILQYFHKGNRTACTDSSTTDAAGHEYCCPGHRSVGGLILCLICGVTRRI